MKPLRLILAALAGAVALFLWGFVGHTFLIGEMGLKPLPGEQAVVPAMQSVLRDHYVYIFPAPPDMKSAPQAEKDAWEAKYKAGPRGIIVYDPAGGTMMELLLSEFASNFAAALVAAVLLSCLNRSPVGRGAAGAAIGLLAWLSVEVSNVIWWRFPWDYAIGSLIDQVVGWLLAGLAIGLILGRRKPAPA